MFGIKFKAFCLQWEAAGGEGRRGGWGGCGLAGKRGRKQTAHSSPGRDKPRPLDWELPVALPWLPGNAIDSHPCKPTEQCIRGRFSRGQKVTMANATLKYVSERSFSRKFSRSCRWSRWRADWWAGGCSWPVPGGGRAQRKGRYKGCV